MQRTFFSFKMAMHCLTMALVSLRIAMTSPMAAMPASTICRSFAVPSARLTSRATPAPLSVSKGSPIKNGCRRAAH